ncbi:MAG TPA: Ser-Thr-rich GPI-anchored membrane family protein [Candidatus Hydrogenedentes bacterium]|nr:Ser-Thr-rich GPI-anchored membrane family protein [Candidatus Hydrogenedentota bacterium]HPG67274.1 Ser-Thr-rich GPI-anchored membrane family protein [Candidatus Hydrogenedentota bacterium]
MKSFVSKYITMGFALLLASSASALSPDALFVQSSEATVRLGESVAVEILPAEERSPAWTYQWTATVGVVEGDGPSAVYTAPDHPGFVVITASVLEDGHEVVRRSVVLFVYKMFLLLKADDYFSWNGDIQDEWQYYLDYLIEQRHIKGSIGLIAQCLGLLDDTDSFITETPAMVQSGYVEVFNHGFDHARDEEHEPPLWYEFQGTPYGHQKVHFQTAMDLAANTLGLTMRAFMAPFGAVDETTETVVSESDDILVWFDGPPDYTDKMVLSLEGGFMEIPAGTPSYAHFLMHYTPTRDYTVVQVHPGYQEFIANFDEFVQVLDFLISEEVTFVLPTEYYYLVTEGVFPLHPAEDSDADGVLDTAEGRNDTDGDGIPDFMDPDSDDDGMTDAWETAHELNRLADDAADDPDMDTFTNLQEFGWDSDPHVNDTFVVLTPEAGAAWDIGSFHTVTWASNTPVVGPDVRIGLHKGGAFVDWIVRRTVDDGEYAWRVPDNLDEGDDYFVRLQSYTDSEARAYSRGSFSLDLTPLTVTAPNGNETWAMGSIRSITWESHGHVIGDSVRIALHKGAAFVEWIARRTFDDGAYSWSIPVTYAPGWGYSIRVQSYDDPLIRDMSDAPFTLDAAPLIITAPQGGTQWAKGMLQEIAWLSNGPKAGAEVRLGLHKGALFLDWIVRRTDNDGIHTWLVPADLPSAVNYRLRLQSFTDAEVRTMSQAFSIGAP